MEIGSLGTQYLDNSRFAVDSLEIVRKNVEGNSPSQEGSFADALEKAQNDGTASTPRIPLSTSRVIIDKSSKLYEQCEALETFLLKNLISGMRKTVPKSEFLSGGFAGDMYEDMLYDEYADQFSKSTDFGLAETAYLELTGQRGKLIANHA
ncbi:hypothetical protein FACS1894151_08640 [Spirochaetia bacterium]|nr:hypothetical protein FACS1894151_08640 [Spirochaetia bacterium]